MAFLIQAIGAIGYITLALSYFKEEKKQILFMQIISYIFFLDLPHIEASSSTAVPSALNFSLLPPSEILRICGTDSTPGLYYKNQHKHY